MLSLALSLGKAGGGAIDLLLTVISVLDSLLAVDLEHGGLAGRRPRRRADLLVAEVVDLVRIMVWLLDLMGTEGIGFLDLEMGVVASLGNIIDVARHCEGCVKVVGGRMGGGRKVGRL